MPEEFTLVKDFAIIMAVAGGALVLFRRLGQPSILGYLLAGVIVGPFTLPNPPVENTETVRLLADLGLVLLLFALGLEFGWERIRQIGLRVIFIGTVEITFMLAIGYEIGTLLGWTPTEAIFLGAAMSISSSAVLAKVLRDTGRLHTTSGRLIVGILVVEDFAAVVLLTLLSAVATTGTASLGDIGFLAGKLALFAISALALGTILAPRLINFVAQFGSQEVLLVASLALCFGLGLIAQELGISAAAGAFLIGTVLGDTEHSEAITRVMSPVRDMFAAIFFVSIGMLVDISMFTKFIGPALIVSAVFILGKVLAITIGTFAAGHNGRTSLRVGMGMPQIGEFSLAMVKVGAERGAVGSFLYPVVTVTTAITSLVYPYVFRSAGAVADFLERRSPQLLKHYVTFLSRWFVTLRSTFSWKGETAPQITRSGRIILLNLGIVMVLIAAGTFVLEFTPQFAAVLRAPESVLGLALGFAVIALCAPPGVAMWREFQKMAEELTKVLFRRRTQSSRIWNRDELQSLLRDSILASVTILLAIWAIPFVSGLLLIGDFSVPVPVLILAGVVFVTANTAFKVYRILEATFSRTFLGPDEPDRKDPP